MTTPTRGPGPGSAGPPPPDEPARASRTSHTVPTGAGTPGPRAGGLPRTPPRSRRGATAPVPPDLTSDLRVMAAPTAPREAPEGVPRDALGEALGVAHELPHEGAPAEPGATDDDTRRPPLPPLPTRTRRTTGRRRGGIWTAAAVVALLVAELLCAYGTISHRSDNLPTWGLVMVPLFAALALLVVGRTGRDETRFDLRGIALFGFGLRCIGAFLRFQAPVDALVYHREGARIADNLRSFDFFVATGRDVPGTGWIRYVSGLSHAFFLDDMFTTFMVFTFLAFVGIVLCYRAFVRAVPNGDHKRYALLLFLWPSLVYWPSSIGKEAWMIFGLGIAAAGVSRILTGSVASGVITMALGLLTLSMVRPHIALMVVIAAAVALLARPGKSSTFRLVGRVAAILLLLIGGSVIAGRTSEVLKLDQDGTEDTGVLDVAGAFALTQERTQQGGAAFTPPVVHTPVEYPFAFVSVWFRPFPWEARGGGSEGASTQMLSAAENLLLLGLIALSWRRLKQLPRALLRMPYITFAATYVVVFVYAFSVIGNFGILARQRTQGTVLFFVLLCLPAAADAATASSRSAASAIDLGRSRRSLREIATRRRRPAEPEPVG